MTESAPAAVGALLRDGRPHLTDDARKRCWKQDDQNLSAPRSFSSWPLARLYLRTATGTPEKTSETTSERRSRTVSIAASSAMSPDRGADTKAESPNWLISTMDGAE
jgi:hypothetical protein